MELRRAGVEGVVSCAPGPVGQQAKQVGMPVELVAVRLDGEEMAAGTLSEQGMRRGSPGNDHGRNQATHPERRRQVTKSR